MMVGDIEADDEVGNLQNQNNQVSKAKRLRDDEDASSSDDNPHSKRTRRHFPVLDTVVEVQDESNLNVVQNKAAFEVAASNTIQVRVCFDNISPTADYSSESQLAAQQQLDYSADSAFLSSLLGGLTPLPTPSPPTSLTSHNDVTPIGTELKHAGREDVIPATPYLEVYKALRAKFRAVRRLTLSSPSDSVHSSEATCTPIVFSQFVASTAKELGTPEDIVRFALEGMSGIRLVEEEDVIVQLDGFTSTPVVPVMSATTATPPSPIDTRLVQLCIDREEAREKYQAATEEDYTA